ncbi:MAG: Ig-like domain-containing protein [Acidobacteriota bacterium]
MSLVLKLAAAGLLALAAHAAEIALENGRFVVRDYPPGVGFSVYVGDSSTPMLGASSTSGSFMQWTPKYPLTEGLTYRAVLGLKPLLARSFTIPRTEREPTRLLAIYPTANQLPENMLKMYLHFSAPMSRGEAYRRVRLLDANGAPVELAILEIAQELWDRSGTRLTILFDPGRIKRDLLPNKEVGPPLQAGRAYELAIDAAWPDANGLPLAAPVSKKFTVGPADRHPPEASSWKLSTPAAGTRFPLTLEFPESMDRALLEQLLSIRTTADAPVPGALSIENEERLCSFTPDAPWSAGNYSLIYDTALEDLAGNRIGRPFDVDLFEKVDREVKRELRRIPIDVRP